MMIFIIFAVLAAVSGNEIATTQKPEKCPENEYWVDCEPGYCEAKSCDQLGVPIPCPGIAPPCPGGCICAEGFLRNSENVCIFTEKCQSCAGDFNATVGRGRNCGKLCSNYKEDKIEYRDCTTSSWDYDLCDCKKGYVYNDIIGQCVDPSDCPTPCNGDHYAESKSCVSLCQPTCADPNPTVCNSTCIEKGCECLPGYILDKPGGKCVKIENCPDNFGCNGDQNAVVTTCASHCPAVCEESEPDFCITSCKPLGCRCKEGFIMSKEQGRCISRNECDKLKKD